MVKSIALQKCPGILVSHIGVFIQLMNVKKSDSPFEEKKNKYIKQR